LQVEPVAFPFIKRGAGATSYLPPLLIKGGMGGFDLLIINSLSPRGEGQGEGGVAFPVKHRKPAGVLELRLAKLRRFEQIFS